MSANASDLNLNQDDIDRMNFHLGTHLANGRNYYSDAIRTGNFDQFVNDRRNSTIKLINSGAVKGGGPDNYWLARGPKQLGSDFNYLRNQYLKDSLKYDAEDFDKDKDSYAASQAGLLKRDIDQNLNQGLNQTRKNYSARGLLYSGLRQNDEGQQRAQATSQYASGRAAINKEVDDRAFGMRQAAAQINLDNYRQIQDNLANMESLRMQNAIQRRQQAAQLGQGLGYLSGIAYANYNTPSQKTNSGMLTTGESYRDMSGEA